MAGVGYISASRLVNAILYAAEAASVLRRLIAMRSTLTSCCPNQRVNTYVVQGQSKLSAAVTSISGLYTKIRDKR
jgi:hypothetical protein